MSDISTSSQLEAGGEALAFVDARCFCDRCEARTKSAYRMVGRCSNCGVEALVLYRSGDRSGPVTCPTCGVWNGVTTHRLATPDEIPVAYEGAAHGDQ